MVRQDNFVSSYAPITEVIVEGPDAPDEPQDSAGSGEGATQGSDASDAQASPSSSDGQGQSDGTQNGFRVRRTGVLSARDRDHAAGGAFAASA